MRAGTLSDPRVVAALRKYFVCVEMTELSTKHLITDPRDVELLRKYGGDGDLGSKFHGGEREAFFSPDGELVDVFLTLSCGSGARQWNGHRYTGQYSLAERRAPEAAVRRWFRGAAKALRKAQPKLPADFRSIQRGRAPEVEAARIAEVQPRTLAAGDGAPLRVTVRADVAMYEQLVGSELLRLSDAHCRRLLPAELTVGQTATWPAAVVYRIFRLAYPRGAGVLIQLEPESVSGAIETRVGVVEGDLVRGSFGGSFRLQPQSDKERSHRSSYKPWRWTSAQVIGDFCWNQRTRAFTGFRLVSRDGRAAYRHGKERENPYRLGIELAVGPDER